VDPWDAIEIYPDFSLDDLRQSEEKQLEMGFADLLPIDSTVLEWKAWQKRLDKKDEAKGRNCITCHVLDEPSNVPDISMPDFVFPGKVEVHPDIAAMHAWLGTPASEAREESLGLWVDVDTYKTMLVATVKILNYGAGHQIPTGVDGRNVLLTVEALDSDGKPLTFFRGPVIPEVAGARKGQPGFLYARLFANAKGEVGVGMEDAVTVFSDSRLQGGEHDELHFTFMLPESAPEDGAAWRVDAKLWWRTKLGAGAVEEEIESASKLENK